MSKLPTILSLSFILLLLTACDQTNAENKENPDMAKAETLVTPTAHGQTEDMNSEEIPVDSPEVEQIDTFPIDVLLGRIVPSKDDDFARIDQKYTSKSGIYLRKEAYEAFVRMDSAAKADGVKLRIVSATRTFGMQKGIWESKWTGARRVGGKNLSTAVPDPVERARTILRYSSMPGTSRHHWGTDIDLNNLENSYFASGEGKKIYDWLTAHAHEYGFCQAYTPIGEERPNGYQEEKWHWSYMPIAKKFLKAYRHQIDYEKIGGFKGSEAAVDLQVIDHYVSGISPRCLDW